MRIYLNTVNRGNIGPKAPQHIAKPSRRYLNLFYWNGYRGHWDKIVAVNPAKGEWSVVKCNGEGKPIDRLRHHDVEMDARCFAHKPFPVRRMGEGGSFVEVADTVEA